MELSKSEHLKLLRGQYRIKLIFIVPLITAIFAWIMGGYMGYQYMTLYWWYAFLLPGAIAILCSLSHRKEENAGKYYSVFSMPVNLSRFEFAKGIILVEKLLVSAIFLALLISISNIIAPATAVYSLLHSITGSIGIILASVWQIPLCLYLARKTGMFVPIVLNTILGIVLSTATALGNTVAWWFVPYCWAAKLAEPLMGIEMNGTYAGNCGFSIAIMISISLSILLFLILSYADAKNFPKGGRQKWVLFMCFVLNRKNEAYIVLGYSFLCTRYGGIVISCLLFPVCQHRRQ